MVLFVVQTTLQVMNILLNLTKNVMCTNKRWVKNKYNGKEYFVPCGTCKACQQEKAGKRANRIVNNFSNDKICLFVHLTYANDCLPYVTWSDLLKYKEFNEKDKRLHTVVKTLRGEEREFYLLPLYRDSFNRRIRFSTSWNTSKHRIIKPHTQIDVIPIDSAVINHFDFWQCGYHHPTNHYLDDSLSVCYFKDLQNFIKRLRSYVTYHKEIFIDNSQREFEYYVCSEYGENFSRAHFHALFWVSRDSFKKWRQAIAANWQFDDYDFTFKNIEIAKKPASYVSTYVTCNVDLPVLLQQRSCTQKWSYSKHFGFKNNAFGFREVLKSINAGNAEYSAKFVGKDGVHTFKSVPLPSYVTNYYFPKFKGMYHLSIHEAFDIFEYPINMGKYATRLGIESKNELNVIIKTLLNKRKQFYELLKIYPINFEVSDSLLSKTFSDTFAYWALRCHSARKKSQWKTFYENMTDSFSIIYSYDNFADTFDRMGHLSFQYLDFLPFECDPNKYPLNLSKNDYLLQKYEHNNKSHKVNNKQWQILTKTRHIKRNSDAIRLI